LGSQPRTLKSENLTYQDAKTKIIGELNESLKRCIDVEIQDIGDIEDNRGTLYFCKTDQPNEFEFNVLSSGEKEVVDIILDLYLRRDVYNDTVFLIDEPELHLNTAIQRKLILEIDRLVGRECQIWISTHSIGFMRAFQNELKDECAIIEFTKDMRSADQELTLTPMRMGYNDWRRLFATALDDLTELVCPKQLIYCEGRDKPGVYGKERGFDAKVYNRIFGSEFPNTLFISSGGNTELDQRSAIAISILGKVTPSIDILVLKDRDASSGKTTDRDTYLHSNADNHRMLKRFEIENYLFDKEVLKAYCVEKQVEFDEETYDSKFKDINNADVKSLIGLVKKLCGINSSIDADKFKLRLAEKINKDMQVYKELAECIF